MSADVQTQVFKAGSTTYFNSSLFFPPAMRAEVFALYGFVRVADNYVDAVPQEAESFRRFVARYRVAREGEPAFSFWMRKPHADFFTTWCDSAGCEFYWEW